MINVIIVYFAKADSIDEFFIKHSRVDEAVQHWL